jgi:hypothetical protein
LTVDYLRGNATASAVGLFVICRYLSAFADGRSEDELGRALQVLRPSGNSADEASSVLSACLAIGDGLGIVGRDSASVPWAVDADLAKELQAEGDQWPWFRGELLRRMTQHGLRELEEDGKAPDLILGLTSFLQLSPLSPLQLSWDAELERRVRALTAEAVSRSEQWRPFQRWALALGLARRFDQGGAKVIIPDASTGIIDQLPFLPSVASAPDWLAALRKRLPVLGATALLQQLPKGGATWDELPAGVVIGLLKLEKAGVLSLESSDDASDVIALGLGTSMRQVGRIVRRSM